MHRIANPFSPVRLRAAPPNLSGDSRTSTGCRNLRDFWSAAIACVVALLFAGCTGYGVVQNQPIADVDSGAGYSLAAFASKQNRQAGELALLLAFSGGGTRAAALSYGVLQELRDTRVRIDGRDMRLLDAVSLVSSVSGGSFTSAYYGLYGDRAYFPQVAERICA